MANTDKADLLLLHIHKLEKLITEQRENDSFNYTFFEDSFDLLQSINKDLHSIQSNQMQECKTRIEELQKANALLVDAQKKALEIVNLAASSSCDTSEATPVPPQKEEPKEEKKAPEHCEQTSPIAEEKKHISESKAAEQSFRSFNEVIEKKILSDIWKGLSLNDRFRFRRELFGGNETKMSEAIDKLNECSSLEESMNYINNELKWELSEEAPSEFIKLIEKRFL